MKIVIISSSLSKKSRSIILAEHAWKYIVQKNIESELLDLRDYDLPFCDGDESFLHPQVREIKRILKTADAFLIATPIYNYDANAAIKNVIELTGSVWEDKAVGFLCKAGGNNSYMSIIALANSLMFNFRCLIIPRFVYALSSAFDEEKKSLKEEKIKIRVEQLCDKIIQLAHALTS